VLLRGSTADLQRTPTTVDRLVPRRMAVLGLIASPVLLARFVGILPGVFEPMSVLGIIMVVPEFL
jgi:hypothetical protein